MYVLANGIIARPAPAAVPAASAEVAAEGASPAPAAAVVEPADGSPRLASKLNVAEMILSKYPDFDPSWTAEVQAKWLDGMTKLYEGLAAAERRRGRVRARRDPRPQRRRSYLH